jgi:hypothetical protein
MKEPTLFDLSEGERAKKEGMEFAEAAQEGALRHAREIARRIAQSRPDRCCTADDVGRALRAQGLPDCLGPAAGSLFRGNEWKFTGRFVKSARIKNHARLLRVWQLLGC